MVKHTERGRNHCGLGFKYLSICTYTLHVVVIIYMYSLVNILYLCLYMYFRVPKTQVFVFVIEILF